MIGIFAILREALSGLGYSMLGLVVGYSLGRAHFVVERIEEAVVSGHTPMSGEDGNDSNGAVLKLGEKSMESPSGWQGRLLGVFVLVMTLVTVTSTIYTNSQTRQNSDHDKRVTACQAQYNRDFAQAVTLRGKYADEDRLALYRMITTIISGSTPEIRQKAVTDWVLNSQKNDQLRKNTPLPNLDTRNCEEVR